MTEQFLEKVERTAVNVLARLHQDAKDNKDDLEEYVRIGEAVCKILNKLEQDFYLEFMLYVFCKTKDRLGESLGPINAPLLKKLLDNGFTVKELNVVVSKKKR